MGIQINGNTNNINAGIGSLSIEDLNELDIVGVATASNFKTGSSNLHSTGLTVGNALVHSTGINVGTGATVHCPATNVLTFGTNSNERLRIDSNGTLQVQGDGNAYLQLERYQNNANGSRVRFVKSRSDTVGTNAIVQDGDTLGVLDFYGSDGNSGTRGAASISAEVDGTPGSADMPGRLVFKTVPDGSTVLAERLRITSAGKVGINSTSPTNMLDVVGTADMLGLYRNDFTGNSGAGLNLNFGRAKADGSLFNCARIAAVGSDNTAQNGQLRFSVLDSGSMSEKLRINSSGYVGVKRSTPLANLHTTNNELAIGSNPTGAAAPNATYDGLVVDGEQASLINIRSCATGNTSYGRVAFSDDVRSRGYIDYRHRDGAGGALEFMNFAVAGSERLRITSSGAINLTSENTTGWQLDAGDNSASYTAIDNHFPTTNRTLYMNNETTHRSIAFWNKNGSDGYGFGLDNSGNFKVVYGSSERLRIGSNGQVIISNPNPPSTGAMMHVTDDGSATTLGTAATFRVSNDGGSGNYSVFEAQSGSGSMRLANDGQFYVSGASIFSDDIRVDRGSAIDGLVGQAYGGYFGLKHADQSYGSEYMMISNNSNTYISCTSGYGIYLRPSANSSAHQTIFAHDTTTFNTHLMLSGHNLQRSAHHTGHLEGSYNNVGANSTKSNPIYTIGSSYNPADGNLSNMYGIGYSHGTNASFISMTNATSWGLYVASDGDCRAFIDSSNGKISITSTITQNASDVRLKTNIKVIDNPIEKIKKIRGVTFDWVDNITSEYDFHPDSMHETGVIAQEIQEVIPDAVTTAPFNGNYTKKSGTDNNFLTVKDEKIIPLCIEAIKELSAQVELLKSKVATLEGS